MLENTDIIFRALRSHWGRWKEGQQLLKQGQSLAKMTRSIDGLTNEENLARRTQTLNTISSMDDDQLKSSLQSIEKRIQASMTKYSNWTSSEIAWERNALLDEMDTRKSKLTDKQE